MTPNQLMTAIELQRTYKELYETPGCGLIGINTDGIQVTPKVFKELFPSGPDFKKTICYTSTKMVKHLTSGLDVVTVVLKGEENPYGE